MDIYPAALEGRTRADIFAAVQDSRLTTHIGNAPTQIFMVGEDTTGQLLEITTVVRHEDVFVVHATPARAPALGMLATVDAEPNPSKPDDGKIYGISADELALTGTVVDQLFETADAGYDVDRLLTRTRPGRPAPMTVGSVLRVGLTEEKLASVQELANAEGVSVEEFITAALADLVQQEGHVTPVE